ncbi:uncharacterized protein [Phyllobates terribilis]|uniref:uncharacterized protein n=1 Tax=Phyllobates terribilis TaxID=111132 RepID=UPI003CCB313F
MDEGGYTENDLTHDDPVWANPVTDVRAGTIHIRGKRNKHTGKECQHSSQNFWSEQESRIKKENVTSTDLHCPFKGIEESKLSVNRKIVREYLANINEFKSPGPDELHPRVLKEIVEEILEPLSIIFENSWRTGEVPEDWRRANVVPIFKKGKKVDPGNYRPKENVTSTDLHCPFKGIEESKLSVNRKIVREYLANINEFKSPGPDELHPRVLKEIVEEILEPLSIIFENSWRTGEVPEDWRRANVVPIFKKGKKVDPGNYRPVSLTSIPGKIFEQIIKQHVCKYMDKNEVINQTLKSG